MITPLEGHIEYRLNLGSSSKARKKPRLNSGIHLLEEDEDVVAEAGFYFVVLSSRSSHNETYLLSVPHCLKKSVCDAARFHGKVRVSSYGIVPLLFGKGKRSFCEMEAHSKSQLLEIHRDGLEFIPINETTSHQEGDFLSLQQLHYEEIQKNQNKAKPSTHSNKSQRPSNLYNLKGTVDSVSPILAIDEPFALMELYDSEAEEPLQLRHSPVGRQSSLSRWNLPWTSYLPTTSQANSLERTKGHDKTGFPSFVEPPSLPYLSFETRSECGLESTNFSRIPPSAIDSRSSHVIARASGNKKVGQS